MKLNAAVKVGLIGGLVFAVCMHVSVFLLMYESTYQFKMPSGLTTPLAVTGWLGMVATALALGPLAVRAAGDAARGWRDAALTGGGAGLVVGAVTFMAVGTLALVMVLGVVPLIVPLSNPASVTGEPVETVLRPVVQQAVPGVYSSLLGYLLSWSALGAVEGAVFALVRTLVRKKVSPEPQAAALP